MTNHDTASFFRPIRPELGIADSDYACTAPCVAMAEALSRNSNHSLYIIDYNRHNFLYVSPNPLFLCGRSREEVQRQGYAFYFEVVPPDEMQRLTEVNKAGFRFYYDRPAEQRLALSIEYDFHIRASEGKGHLLLIHHQLTPILLSPNGDIWLALCTVSLASTPTPGDVLISDHARSERYRYSFEGRRWRKVPEMVLNERERDILRLSVKGLSNAEIGEALCIEANTVKFHKKKLFEKLHARNIIEAMGIAAQMRLI